MWLSKSYPSTRRLATVRLFPAQEAFEYYSLLLLLAPISPFHFVTNVTKTQFVIVISVVVCARNMLKDCILVRARRVILLILETRLKPDSRTSSPPALIPAAKADPVMRRGSFGPLLLMSLIKYASFVVDRPKHTRSQS